MESISHGWWWPLSTMRCASTAALIVHAKSNRKVRIVNGSGPDALDDALMQREYVWNEPSKADDVRTHRYSTSPVDETLLNRYMFMPIGSDSRPSRTYLRTYVVDDG